MEEREITPTQFRGRLTEKEKRAAEVLAVMQNQKQREFWEAGMRRHLELRKELGESGDFNREEFYRLLPRDAEPVVLYADEGLLQEVFEWAEKDDVLDATAQYTFARRYIEEVLERMGWGFDDLETGRG